MKKLRSFLHLFAVLVFGLAIMFVNFNHVYADNRENLIKNGDFEQGNIEWGDSYKGVVTDTDSYGEGRYSGLVPPDAIQGNMASGYIGQIVSIEPNTEYSVSAFAKTDREGAYGYFTARWWDNGRQGSIVTDLNGNSADQKVDTTDWKKYNFTFHSGYHTKVLIQLVKWSDEDTTKSANIYMDHVEMYREQFRDPYTEIWKDDFNGDELNTNDWGYELGAIRGWEQQHYVNSSENVFLRDGNLVLKATNRAKADQYDNPRNNARKVIYNSGSIRTHGKREFLYGKLEIRAKLPKGQGVFPAFWTLGSDFILDGKINADQGHGWPSCGEIDIMELIGNRADGSYGNRTVYQTLHYGSGEDDNGKYAGNGTPYSISDGNFNDSYHTFALDWSKDQMSWLVDGKIVRTVHYGDDKTATGILNKPQYIQLNLAMGGAWPGQVDENLAGTEYVIDYVKYSQTDLQKSQAEDYYRTAPTLTGVRDIAISEGEIPDLLEGISTQEGYQVDYSIDDEYMFVSDGGNTAVHLVCTGDRDKEKIADLKPGKYNIHYSAYPMENQGGQPYDSRIARKTAVLTIY